MRFLAKLSLIRGLSYKSCPLKLSNHTDPSCLHIIIPHKTNWRLTETNVKAFLRFTERPYSITLVNNFDSNPMPALFLSHPAITVIQHSRTWLGQIPVALNNDLQGSLENALALDVALATHPQFEWAFMAHSDAAPLAHGWEKSFFDALDGGFIIGNYRDKNRIHAAHASGTLFHQKTFLQKNISMNPRYVARKQIWDVGDAATVVLHPSATTPVCTLPNTINEPGTIGELLVKYPDWGKLAQDDGSAVSLDSKTGTPVYAHMGRGTPRSLKDPGFSHKSPVDRWIELVNGLPG